MSEYLSVSNLHITGDANHFPSGVDYLPPTENIVAFNELLKKYRCDGYKSIMLVQFQKNYVLFHIKNIQEVKDSIAI